MMGIVIFVIVLFFQNASAQYAIPRSVFGNGGATLSSSANKLVGTLGQPFIGTMGGTPNRQNAGFWYVHSNLITLIEGNSVELPTEYRLEQNYPNPFNPSTTIRFSLPLREQVILKVFDALGREVTTLVDKQMEAGEYSVVFNTSDLSSGVYFYRLKAGNFVEQKKMVFVK
jgi:hypothetical protein